MSDIVIRLLTPEDALAFKQIRLESLRSEPSAFASTFADWEALSDSEWASRLAETPVFVAFLDGLPIGVMGLMRQRASKMAHRATVIMVYVRKSQRGAGVAKDLLTTLTAYAARNEIRQLELAVSAENLSAYRFYQREGFMDIGRIPGGYLHEGREIDEIMMACRIT